MDFFKTKSCCCGISLETGSIAIVIVNLLFGFSFLGNALTILSSVTTSNGEVIDSHGNGGSVFYYLLYPGIEIICLYGILQKKPLFLIPHLVLHALSFILVITVLIIVLIALILFKYWIVKFLEDQFGAPSAFYIIFILLLVTCIVFSLVQYHFFSVVFSYYFLLKIETTTGLPQAGIAVA